jgi:tetratricopeptide (TPR) repeat protein
MHDHRLGMKPALALLVALAVVIGWTNHRLSKAMAWRYPAVNELVVTENYLEDLGSLLIGAHRLAADIAYIQFLQYYGIQGAEEELGPPGSGHHEEHGHGDRRPRSWQERQAELDAAKGYPRMLEFATRIDRLDPYFNGAVIEAAGALSFNQKRIDEALTLLKEAIERDPSYFRYHLYVSAILYKQKGNDAGMIGLLMEAIKYPDCPALFELILGNLLKKVGRTMDAAQVFLHTLNTAPAPGDRKDALRRLNLLLEEHPEIAPRLRAGQPAR